MNLRNVVAGMRGQLDYRQIGVLIALIALAAILFVIVRGILTKGFG